MNYKPNQTTRDNIPLINYLYYEEKLSARSISKKTNIAQSTIRNVINYILNGKRDVSDIAKTSYNSLTNEQKANLTKKSIEKRKTDPTYKYNLAQSKIGTKNPQSVLSETDVYNIRKEYQDLLDRGYLRTESQFMIANQYKVKRPSISDIVLYRTWKHVD